MRIELYAGHTPYIDIEIKDVVCFIPFKHTLEFFTKSPDHNTWCFDDMDEEEFTPEMRKINEWDWILKLDGAYNHGTMICCTTETIHGNRFSIHAKKNYHTYQNGIEVSVNIGQSGPILYGEMSNAIREIEEIFPRRVTTSENIEIRPEGRVSIYTMNCLKYVHNVNL